MCSATGDFGLGAGDVYDYLLLVERRGEGFDEVEVAQIFEDRAAPLGQRGGQVAAGLLELSGGCGLQSGILLGDKASEVVLIIGDDQLVSRRCAGQGGTIEARATQQPAQIRDVGVQCRPRSLRWSLIPRGADQRIDAHRAIRVHDQHRQHRSLFGRAQRY